MRDLSTVANAALTNVTQLMLIALKAPDEHISKVYGGEHGMIDLIERYWAIYKDAVKEDHHEL